MRRLHIDFNKRRGPDPLAWGILAASLLTLGSLVWSHDHLRRETVEARSHARLAEPAAPARPLVMPEVSAAELAAARDALLSIGMPWDGVFGALEEAATRDVALLAVNPDPRKGELRVTAEARNLAAMLAYHQRLERAPALRNVALVDHEVVATDPQQPVRFNITANWVIDRGQP